MCPRCFFPRCPTVVEKIMKTILLLPLVLCAVLLAGCQKSPDGAKMESLSRKMDALLQEESLLRSDQVAMVRELGFMRRQMFELPNMTQIDASANYYHTNTLTTIQGQLDTKANALLAMDNLLMSEDGLILTNLFALESLNPAASQTGKNESIADIARRLQMEDDISQMNQKLDDLQLELRRFEAALGLR